jgi:hypothetical protein
MHQYLSITLKRPLCHLKPKTKNIKPNNLKITSSPQVRVYCSILAPYVAPIFPGLKSNFKNSFNPSTFTRHNLAWKTKKLTQYMKLQKLPRAHNHFPPTQVAQFSQSHPRFRSLRLLTVSWIISRTVSYQHGHHLATFCRCS